jgi:hypothetical protein
MDLMDQKQAEAASPKVAKLPSMLSNPVHREGASSHHRHPPDLAS